MQVLEITGFSLGGNPLLSTYTYFCKQVKHRKHRTNRDRSDKQIGDQIGEHGYILKGIEEPFK